jgi:D5 N terminal like
MKYSPPPMSLDERLAQLGLKPLQEKTPQDETEKKPKTKGKVADSILAKTLSVTLSETLAYDETSGEWCRYGKGLWQPKTITRALKDINKILHQHIPDGFSLSKLKSIEGFLRLYLAQLSWITDKNLLPLKNGILDVQKLELMPFSPKHKFRWQLPFDYDKDAKTQVIDEWLADVTEQDRDKINIIRAFMKITLLGGGISI